MDCTHRRAVHARQNFVEHLGKELPKRADQLLESLLWQAAWSGDEAAFKLGEKQLARRRAATERMATIHP